MSRRAAIFDLDGTLVDLPVPIEAVRAEVAALFAARGWSGKGPRSMRPILATIDAAAARVAASDAEARALVAEARGIIDRAEIEAARGTSLIDGAAELLAAFAGPIAVVTNNCAESARVALAGHRIDAFVGRDDVARPKPDPEGLLAALDRLGASSALWVGDRASDVAAGLAARAARPELELEIVGFVRAPGRAGELSGADRIVESLAAVDTTR